MPVSTDGDKRHPPALVVTGDTLGARVEGRLAIDDKPITMVAVLEGQVDSPGAVGLALQGVDRWIPVVEVAGYGHMAGLGRPTHEGNGLNGLLGDETLVLCNWGCIHR